MASTTFGEYLKGIEGNAESSAKAGSFGDYLKNNETTINDSMAQSPTTGTLGTYGQMLGQAVKGIPASVASMVEGSTPYTENNFLDKIQADDQVSQQEFINRPGRDAPALGGLASQGEIREAAPSLSGSMVSMAPMLAGAGAGAAIGSAVPLVGTALGGLAGGVIGTGLGLYGMYRQGENQFVKQAVDQENANRAEQSLSPLTQQEAIAKQDQINASGDTAKSGLAQSLPEMAGNAAELGIAMTPIGKAGGIVSKLIPKNVLGRAAAVGGAKFAAVMGTELGEEEITRRFQNPINERNNLPTQSFADIAKPTLIATAPFGALAGGAGIYHGIKGPMDNAAAVAPVVDPIQPEVPVEQPETAATTETPASDTVAPVDVNPATVAPSDADNSTAPTGSKLYGTEEELAQAKQRAATRTEELKKAIQVKDSIIPEDYQFLRDQILHGNNSFEGAIQNLNKRNAERPNTITPASTGTDNQRTEPSTGETRTEIPGTQDGGEVTQGTTDQKLTGENNGQIAGTDQGATNSDVSAVRNDSLNSGIPEGERSDVRETDTIPVDANGRTDGNSPGSNGRGLSRELDGGIDGTGRVSDPALRDNGAIDQNPVLRPGVELSDELTTPVDTAQQPQQEIQDEETIKETPNAGQERLLNEVASDKKEAFLPDAYKPYEPKITKSVANKNLDVSKLQDAKDNDGKPTGWKYFENDNYVGIINPETREAITYKPDAKSGTDRQRAKNVIGNLAADMAIKPKDFPQEELIFKPIYQENNDTKKATNTDPQAESEQPVTGADTIGVDTTGQEEEAKPVIENAKPYKLSTGKALFREEVADKLLSNLEKSENTAGKYHKNEVSKGVFQLIPKTANSKSVEIDGIKPQEQNDPIKQPWDKNEGDSDQWLGSRVEIIPQGKREKAMQGTVKMVLKGSSSAIIEVQPDGMDSTFRYTSDRLKALSIKDSKATEQVSEQDAKGQVTNTEQVSDEEKPKTGYFNANAKDGWANEQMRMAQRAARIANLHGINDKVNAYSRYQIDNIAPENIDKVQDYLLKKYNEIKNAQTTTPEQSITQETKQSDEQVQIPTDSDEVIAQSGKAADGEEEVQSKLSSQDNEIGRGNNVNVKETQQAEVTPEAKTSEQKVIVNDVSDKSIPKKDKDLLTAEEIEARLQSIHKQIQALDDISKPRNMDAYNKRYKNLVDRREELSTRINKIKRESTLDKDAEAKSVQSKPTTDTSGTPSANVDSTDGQEVLGEEAVTAVYDKLSAGDKKKLEGKSSYFWKGEKYKDVATKVISKDNLDVRLKKEPIYGNNKADGNIESYSYYLSDGRRTTKIPDFLGKYIEEIQKELSKPIAQNPAKQPETESKQEDAVANVVAESNETAIDTENKELIGKGSSGEVFKVGNEVEKKSTNDEAKVYALLNGVKGIAKGYEVNGKIRTPYYKNIISVDTIKYDDRKGLAGLISKSVERINHAVSELTNAGYYYNDPLQFGMNEDHSLDLIDFSMATNKEGDRVINDNLSLLASFYKQFGLTRQAEAVSQVKEVITNQHHHVKYGTNALLGDEFDGVNYKELTDRLDGKKANNAYYTTNARYVNIKNTAQTDNINGIKTVLSVNKLSDKDIKGWELIPVHEQSNDEFTTDEDSSPLSIFTQMDEAGKVKPRSKIPAAEKAAQERMDASPIADRLNYIHKNYYSLVQELIERKDDPVKLTNCKTL